MYDIWVFGWSTASGFELPRGLDSIVKGSGYEGVRSLGPSKAKLLQLQLVPQLPPEPFTAKESRSTKLTMPHPPTLVLLLHPKMLGFHLSACIQRHMLQYLILGRRPDLAPLTFQRLDAVDASLDDKTRFRWARTVS